MSVNLKKGYLLFSFFFKIGCFTFGGGWSILAQMDQEFVEKRNMITRKQLTELVAVGKSIPGIMITNISMLFGYQVAGWVGGVCSVLGITCPAVLILSFVTICYDMLKDNFWADCAFKGVQAAVIPIVATAALSLGKEVLASKKGKIITILTMSLYLFTDISNIMMIIIGVGAALLLYFIKRIRKTEEGGTQHDIS